MKRTKLNFIIDAIAFVAFSFLTTTGILMYYILPPGSGRRQTIWGLNRHDWGDLHYWTALCLFISLTVHLALHWRWLVNVIKGHRTEHSGLRLALGIVGLIAAIALSVAPLMSPVDVKSVGGGQHQHGKRQ